jgi:cysteine dioxygenase
MGTATDFGLQDWLRKLQAFDERRWKTMRVDELFTELAEPPEDWYAHLQFCEDSYTRNLVGRNDLFELIAIGWLGHQKTPIHDHAGQRCWMWVVHGDLTFQTYRQSPRGFLAIGDGDELGPGKQIYIDDKIGWHSIENATRKPAVSLHLYARPISQCQVFCDLTQTIQTRELEILTLT